MEDVDIIGKITAVEARCKSNSHRLDELETRTEAVKSTGDKVDGLCSDVQELKAEPGKRWKFVVEKAIYIAVAAIMGYALARLGLG